MATPQLSERIKAANKWRKQVIARENEAINFLTKSWEVSARKLQTDIDNMVYTIEQARIEGKPINKDWLRREKAYRDLQKEIIETTDRYSKDAAERIRKDVEWAAQTGVERTINVILESFPFELRGLVSFNTLPEPTVLAIGSRVAPGTPAGDLFLGLGDDTAAASRNVLIDGINRGKNVRVIARELKDVSWFPRNRSLTIARTEIFGAYRDAHHEQILADKDVLDGWVWMAQTQTCCGGCLAKHGEKHLIGDFMQAHPNCHCEPIPITKSWEDLGFPVSLDTQFSDKAFDPNTMKATAQDVLKQSEKDLAKRFGPGKAKAIKSGEIKLDQLATEMKSSKWGNSIVETPLKNLLKGA